MYLITLSVCLCILGAFMIFAFSLRMGMVETTSRQLSQKRCIPPDIINIAYNSSIPKGVL